jgi:sulfite exporter TauE/SafE
LRTWRFWAFAIGVLSGAIPLHMVLIHQVAAVSDAGFSKELAAFGLGLIGLFTAPAMIFMGCWPIGSGADGPICSAQCR